MFRKKRPELPRNEARERRFKYEATEQDIAQAKKREELLRERTEAFEHAARYYFQKSIRTSDDTR